MGDAAWCSYNSVRLLLPPPPLSKARFIIKESTNAKRALRVACAQIRKDGFSGDGCLPLGDQGPHSVRQVDIDTRAEPDHAYALARSDRAALTYEANDT